MHLPNSLSSESFQPGYLSGQVVSVDVHVHATLPPVEALDQQPELLAAQPGPVLLRMPVKLGQRLANRGLPERQLPVVFCGRHVDNDPGQPAVMAHPVNLRERAPRSIRDLTPRRLRHPERTRCGMCG
jgi:hypothetical protein